MFIRARNRFKKWELARLNRRISKLNNRNWILPYRDVYGKITNCVSRKPLFFTDATSFKSFIDSVAHSGTSAKCSVSLNLTSNDKRSSDAQIDWFINAAPGERTTLTIAFESADSSSTIAFNAKTDSQKARTEILGSQSNNDQLSLNIMAACDRYAKPMGLIQRHRTMPLVEPISSQEESDRRNRWETNWKNIVVSAITGLLAGIVPLIVKAALHL